MIFYFGLPVGVGYGQIMLESILCGTEVLCYLPIGDAEIFVKENSYKSIKDILERIKGNLSQRKIIIPDYMKEKHLEIEHRNLFKKILGNKLYLNS